MSEKRKRRLNWFYLPAVAIMLIFILYPLINAIVLSFYNWNGYSVAREFIGFSNYVSMFQDKVFLSALRNTLIYGIGSTALQQVIGIALALLLNSKYKGRNVIRTVVYMPAMISGLVMGYMMYFFFQFKNGALNDLLAIVGGSGRDWLGVGRSAIIIIVLVNVWQFVGVSMVLYLAGLQGISNTYIEASSLDGANSFQRFRYVILPLLMPAITSSVTYNLIGGLKLYDVIIALTNGGPANKTHSLATYIANRYFDAERAGYAAAIGVISFVLILVISLIVNHWFAKREVEV